MSLDAHKIRHTVDRGYVETTDIGAIGGNQGVCEGQPAIGRILAPVSWHSATGKVVNDILVQPVHAIKQDGVYVSAKVSYLVSPRVNLGCARRRSCGTKDIAEPSWCRVDVLQHLWRGARSVI